MISFEGKHSRKYADNKKQKRFQNNIFSFLFTDAVSPLYESINFDRDLIPTKPRIDQTTSNVPVPKLRRQNAVAQPLTASEEKQNHGKCPKSFLDGIIPPPPPSPPPTSPPNAADTDDDDDLAHVGTETMEKLNKLYEMRNFLRSSNETEDETNEFDEIVYRIRDFDDFSRRSKRGSSKPMCSLVSVRIENSLHTSFITK